MKPIRKLPSSEFLHKLFWINGDTLYWRRRQDARPQWNGHYANKPAGNRHPRQEICSYHATPELAHEEYKKLATRHYGEFARFA